MKWVLLCIVWLLYEMHWEVTQEPLKKARLAVVVKVLNVHTPCPPCFTGAPIHTVHVHIGAACLSICQLGLGVSHLALNPRTRSSLFQVTYPGLPEHPGHALLKSLSNEGFGFGGLLGLEFPTIAVAETFMQRLQNK